MSATSSEKFSADQVQQLIRERRFVEARAECQLCLSRQDSSETDKKAALHLLGSCHYLQGELTPAIECFKRILSVDPKHTDAAISLSIIYNDVGRYDDAKKIYQVANQSLALKRHGTDDLLDRKFALKHVELGDLYFKYHRYDDALSDYSRAARLAPRQLDIRIKMAKVYAKKGFTTRAIQELQQLCHEQQDYVAGRVHLGLMYFSQGNVIDAQLEWDRALKQDPSNPEIQTYLEMAKQATETSV
ncbi:MAG: tetratricopeptide repeat protein [Deltaproteobacteria bacterium]|nr:tetratricopeptide repeat protein [Deltaproteobacteria bacterium]